MQTTPRKPRTADSSYAWWRLAVSLALSTIGGVGLWSAVVVLPTIETEFGVDRGGASLPYTAAMVGFAIGGVLMGRWPIADIMPLLVNAPLSGLGFIAAAFGVLLAVRARAGALIGMLELRHIQSARGRRLALVPALARHCVATVASGTYLAGAIWPSVLEHTIAAVGWRQSYMFISAFCVTTMVPLALLLRGRAVMDDRIAPTRSPSAPGRLPMSPAHVQGLLVVAAIACCVAMSMPQVHIIAYCGDLGYGTARGAEMLSVMLGFGVVSRLASGFVADRIGGLKTLILGSALQCLSLIFYLPFDGLTSLTSSRRCSGLRRAASCRTMRSSCGNIFRRARRRPRELVLMASVVGMALGGWMSGEIHDLTGLYQAAFLNGIVEPAQPGDRLLAAHEPVARAGRPRAMTSSGPALFDPRRHLALAPEAWDAAVARAAIREIVDDTLERFDPDGFWPPHPLDEGAGQSPTSLYFGAAGVLWALDHLRRAGAVEFARIFAGCCAMLTLNREHAGNPIRMPRRCAAISACCC
jgi:hypothetical protein